MAPRDRGAGVVVMRFVWLIGLACGAATAVLGMANALFSTYAPNSAWMITFGMAVVIGSGISHPIARASRSHPDGCSCTDCLIGHLRDSDREWLTDRGWKPPPATVAPAVPPPSLLQRELLRRAEAEIRRAHAVLPVHTGNSKGAGDRFIRAYARDELYRKTR